MAAAIPRAGRFGMFQRDAAPFCYAGVVEVAFVRRHSHRVDKAFVHWISGFILFSRAAIRANPLTISNTFSVIWLSTSSVLRHRSVKRCALSRFRTKYDLRCQLSLDFLNCVTTADWRTTDQSSQCQLVRRVAMRQVHWIAFTLLESRCHMPVFASA